MKLKIKGDQIVALGFLILGCYIFYETYSFKVIVQRYLPGPEVVPRGIGAIMIILSLVVIFLSSRKKAEKTKSESREVRRSVLVTIGIVLLFAILTPVLGIYVMAFLLPLIFHIALYEEEDKYSKRRLSITLTVSIVLVALLSGVFHKVLHLDLPTGIFSFLI